MKNIIYLCFIISMLFISACSKDANSTSLGNGRDLDSKLIGTWRYEETLDISTDVIIFLSFNADGSAEEVIIHQNIRTNAEIVQSDTPFKWNTVRSKGEIYFLINGKEQATTYNFNNNLIIDSYNTLRPNFIKQ